MQPTLAEALTRALSCGVWPREGRLSVYVSYTDESQSQDQKGGRFIIAGYVADELKWPDFSRRWSEEVVTSDPPIPYLHMVEIRSRDWRAKHGINREQAEVKVRKAIEIIAQADFITGYCAHVSEDAYLKALGIFRAEDSKMAAKSKIDYICFSAYALFLTKKLAAEFPDLRKVVFNISNKQDVSNALQGILHGVMEEMFEKVHPKIYPLFGDFVPLNMENHMPLQAADVFCWHLQRAINMSKQEEPETMRNTIAILTKGFCDLSIPDAALEQVVSDYLENRKQEESDE